MSNEVKQQRPIENEINELHISLYKDVLTVFQKACRIGELLTVAKKKLKGDYVKWIDKNLIFGRAQAHKYTFIAGHRIQLCTVYPQLEQMSTAVDIEENCGQNVDNSVQQQFSINWACNQIRKILKPEKKDFPWFLYNIWKTPEGDDKEYFGHFPSVFMRNLLYYHTNESDTVFDPFAGSGTTIDICHEMNRTPVCYDLNPCRKDIKQHDITTGLPDNLPKIDLAFLDPPYWKQAEGKYSGKKTDLGNMELSTFNQEMGLLLTALWEHEVKKIAIVIAPTQWSSDNHRFIDHSFQFAKMLSGYEIEMRYCLPYSTQQYNGTQVEIAKKERITLSIIRDLIIWNRV